MSNAALVFVWFAVLFSAALSLWTHTARVVSIHTVPARYRRRVLWWQANAQKAQLVAIAVAVASLGVYAGASVA